ncbi:HRDC domain-containing protein [Brevibacterium sp. 91QC2O2]|uniref:HRDC domain-containing protein n=1 Tax=Brevibacterium TaxID=1696 RepID=UPI00211CFF40|nr:MULTISPECIES: HRDC domain-containing protein [unclassified Brevibacterium]MCQ9366979.1 HRDC domain-containing protein [Brevibacterium sp. 91QC2O2]MCQ9384128.1 HRDC domain-containing protein [Brevibacterium sp. 68QC2CO]
MSNPQSDDSLEALPLLAEPEAGVPEVVDTPAALATAVAALRSGSGPVGLDAERASGIRYGQRAFLIQLKRAGAGIVLVDPEALPDLREVSRALDGVEWILHAATQDLPCLAERGMHPDALFDTELAAQLLNFERIGLASVVGGLLGVRLAKEHSAVDWSHRPLPHDWLAYAALDVELLPQLEELLWQRLRAAGKDGFAVQEFAHLKTFEPKVYAEPWRRVHGLGALKSRRQLGRVRAMWALRDDLAEDRDVAPGRVVPDKKLVAIAAGHVRSPSDILHLPGKGPTPADAREFYSVLKAADKLPESSMPGRKADAKAGPRVDKDLVKARLEALRASLGHVAAELDMPREIVLAPKILKELAGLPSIGDGAFIADFLAAHAARPWQIEYAADPLARALANL